MFVELHYCFTQTVILNIVSIQLVFNSRFCRYRWTTPMWSRTSPTPCKTPTWPFVSPSATTWLAQRSYFLASSTRCLRKEIMLKLRRWPPTLQRYSTLNRLLFDLHIFLGFSCWNALMYFVPKQIIYF